MSFMIEVALCHIPAYCIQKRKKYSSNSVLKIWFLSKKKDSVLQMELKCAADNIPIYILKCLTHIAAVHISYISPGVSCVHVSYVSQI